MKKFFELSIVRRKTVKGKVITAETLSANDEVLGKLEIKINNKGEIRSGVYVKYIPNQDNYTFITAIRLYTEDKDYIKEVLRELQSLFAIASINVPENRILYMIISGSIDADAGKINLSLLPIPIANCLISMVMKNEWLGIEVEIASELQDMIAKETDAKRTSHANTEPDTVSQALDEFLKS